MTDNSLDRKDLKILAYKESNSALQEQNAELRVEITILSQQLKELNEQMNAQVANEVSTEEE